MNKSFVDISYDLAKTGKEFNAGILNRFRQYFQENTGPRTCLQDLEHERLIQCAAQALSWLQPGIDDDEEEAKKLVHFYYSLMMKVRIESRKSSVSDWQVDTSVRQQINALRTRSRYSRRSKKPLKPVRTEGVIAGLQTWAKVRLPDVQISGFISLRNVQENLLQVKSRISWTTAAPLKLYALDRPKLSLEWPEHPDPYTKQKECYVPIGKRVSESIHQLFGIQIGESEKDHQISQQLQVRMKEWASSLKNIDGKDAENFTLLDINSGLHAMRSINERGEITYD